MAIKVTKMINTSNVLKTIWMNNDISRIEIAGKLKLDKSTITVIVSNLLEKGIVFEIEEGEAGPKGGRKPVKLRLNKSYGCIVGIEMHPNFYMAVLINLEGEILSSIFRKTTINKENFFTNINELMNDLSAPEQTTPPILGIGLGLSGIVNFDKGVINQSIPLNVEDFTVKDILEKKFNLPVTVENDANACCWGEIVFHRNSTPMKNFLFVLIEFHTACSASSKYKTIAVGIGFVFNGKIHHGQTYSAGEFRSIEWAEGCGQMSLDDATAAKVEYDDSIFRKFAVELSKHMAFLVNTLNLNHIFLGGDIEKHKEKFTPILNDAIKENWSYRDKGNLCNIHYSSFGKSAVAYGSAGMMLNKIFMDRNLLQNFYK